MRCCSSTEVGRAVVVERDDLAVEDRVVELRALRQRLDDFGVGDGDVIALAGEQPDSSPSTTAIARMPSHFISKAQSDSSSVAGAPSGGEHRRDELLRGICRSARAFVRRGRRLSCMRWISQFLSRLDQRVLGVPFSSPLVPVSVDDDLVVAPLLQLVGAGVPDRDLAGAVLALGDRALERARTPAGGPRSARRGGSSSGRSARPWAAPTRRARRRARAGSPSAARCAWCSWITNDVAVAGDRAADRHRLGRLGAVALRAVVDELVGCTASGPTRCAIGSLRFFIRASTSSIVRWPRSGSSSSFHVRGVATSAASVPAQRVGSDRRLRRVVLAPVDKHLVLAEALLHVADDELRELGLQRPGELLGERVDVARRPASRRGRRTGGCPCCRW